MAEGGGFVDYLSAVIVVYLDELVYLPMVARCQFRFSIAERDGLMGRGNLEEVQGHASKWLKVNGVGVVHNAKQIAVWAHFHEDAMKVAWRGGGGEIHVFAEDVAVLGEYCLHA